MFIKLERESYSDVIYYSDKPQILVGSADECDLIIEEPTISKKHLKLILESGEWFVLDTGSTNGTYLGHEKIIPWQKLKIYSKDRLLLGAKVAITYLENANDYLPLPGPRLPQDKLKAVEKTELLTLDDFKNSKLRADEIRKKQLQEKKIFLDKKKKEDKKFIAMTSLIALVVMVLGVMGNKFYKARSEKVKKDTIVNKMKHKNTGSNEIELDIEGMRITRSALISRNKIIEALYLPKCADPETIPLCEELPGFKGIVKPNSKALIFFADDSNWEKEATELMRESFIPQVSFRKLMFLLLIKREFQNATLPEGFELYVAFLNKDENNSPLLVNVGAIKQNAIKKITEDFQEDELVTVEYLESLLEELDSFFTVY